MNFEVEFADGSSQEVGAASSREAFKIAMKNYGVGTLILKIFDEEGVEVYAEGNFTDPTEKLAMRLNNPEFINDLLIRFRMDCADGKKRDFYQLDARGQYRISKVDEGKYVFEIFDQEGNVSMKKIGVKIAFEDIENVKHKFDNRICITCGKSIFDLDDPTGECNG